jgi:pimeloyl-ACP methyl ester carboxylesterase
MKIDAIPEIGKSIVADGYKVNYLELGMGDSVIMIHGAGPGATAWANWNRTLPALAQTHRAIALDMLGFGHSDRARGDVYSTEIWVEYLRSFLDALGLERASFIGSSYGGAMTLAFAARYPERVKNFVLTGAVGLNYDVGPDLNEGFAYEPSLENMRTLLSGFYYDNSLLADDLVEARYRASIRPGVQETDRKMFPGSGQEIIRNLSTPDDKIAAIPHKVLICHGREDVFVPVSNAIRMNELIARSQLHIFGQCGHDAQFEHRDRFNALIRQFFNEKD